MKNALFKAKVMHKRLIPKVNQFVYQVYYLCFDIQKVQFLKSKIFSLNKFNLFSFYNKDHGTRNEADLNLWIKEILAKENLDLNNGKIILLTHPRILGYVFNPVSFWFCLDQKDQLIAVLAEVNNTFGDSHNYLLFNQNHQPIGKDQFLTSKKSLYVSPFIKVEGHYVFRFDFNLERIGIWIDYYDKDNKLLLKTSLVGTTENLTSFNLIKYFFQIPLLTFKVIILIHFQAIKLWFKKIKFITRPV